MYKFLQSRTVRQMLACFPVLINQFLMGLGWGWTAPTLVKVQSANSSIQLTEEEVSWIVSTHEIGRISSPIICPFIVDSIGRRYTVALVSALIILIWVSHTFVCDAYLICALRFLFGATNGLQDIVSPIYTTENCSEPFRRAAAGLMSIVFTVGKCFELVLATHTSYEMTAVANTFVSVCAFGAFYFCVETPSFLIMKGKFTRAQRNLEWLQADLKPNELSSEMEKLKDYVHKEKEKKKSIRGLLSCAENVKSVCVVFSVYLASTATGGIAFGVFAPVVFASTEPLKWSHFLIVGETVNFISLIIAPIINAKIKPRNVLMGCYSEIAASHIFVGVLFYLHARNHEIKFYPWLVFVAMLSYGIVRSIAGPASYVMRGEILPLSIRAIGGSVAVITQAGTGFCILKAFLPLTEHFGMEANFVLYAVMALTTSILAYSCLPSEARNESTGEKDKDLKPNQTKSEAV